MPPVLNVVQDVSGKAKQFNSPPRGGELGADDLAGTPPAHGVRLHLFNQAGAAGNQGM